MNFAEFKTTLVWQFEMTWQLTEHHLAKINDDMCLWEPSSHSWSVRKKADGRWRPDWADAEPELVPTVTIGWLTWQILWWWKGIVAALQDGTPASHEQVDWPGDAEAVIAEIRALGAEWITVLNDLKEEELSKGISYPWPDPQPMTFALAWVNSELMKNVAEIGYIHHLYKTKAAAL